MKSITILIDKTGHVSMKTQGFEGTTCKDATRALEQGLGIVLSDKPSFDQGTSHFMVETQQ
jgi:hypothetical protein